MTTLIITEKTSQARDLRAALGTRFGQILPAEGHLLRLAEPHEVNPDWKSWACVLLKPSDLYPTREAREGNKPAKLRAIASALQEAKEVILATDCDREGQLIGQEILEHLSYRGHVHRALFTAQDPKSLRQAFDKLRPNRELRPLYEAAVARQQADQIFNLSLTRTATRTLIARGTKGVIGIGRVKTPTLAIVCMREIEIRDFKVEQYLEILATAKVPAGMFLVRHAPPAKARIRDKAVAEMIAASAGKYAGPITVSVEHRRQAPPRLYDLPSLQKTCGQRWGWTADKTLSITQELYDGEGKKVLTYPRAEARHLAENQIADVPVIVGAMLRLRGFAHLTIDPPVIRRGKSGHFCDKSLEGVSHHAIVPNVNVMDDLEARIARLSDDEKRLFALICRSYLAAMMPDYEYTQTIVTMQVPVAADALPDGVARESVPKTAEFRAVGRIPVKPGWKAVYGANDPEQEAAGEGDKGKKGKPDKDADQDLPAMKSGDRASLSKAKVQEKKTAPPPRYSEGTLVDAMQNAWRFVTEEALRERLKEAKGIGTPATRAEIIKGLKRQSLIAADGKYVVPTPAGLQIYELLRAAAPALVDPGTTAVWEMRLDDVVTGKADFRAVIDEISREADRLIRALRQRNGITVDLSRPPPRGKRKKHDDASGEGEDKPPRAPRQARRRNPAGQDAARHGAGKTTIAPDRERTAHHSHRSPRLEHSPDAGYAEKHPSAPRRTPQSGGGPPRRSPPTERMVGFAQRLARDKQLKLPEGYEVDFEICRRFLDQHTGRG